MTKELIKCCDKKPEINNVIGSRAYIIKCLECTKQVNTIGYFKVKVLWNNLFENEKDI